MALNGSDPRAFRFSALQWPQGRLRKDGGQVPPNESISFLMVAREPGELVARWDHAGDELLELVQVESF